MNDQQQQDQKPTLSSDEILDVLEAVWKIGQEKGLQLLRPDQVKKLIDSGRTNTKNRTFDEDIAIPDGEKKKLTARDVADLVNVVVEGMVHRVFETYKQQNQQIKWEELSEGEVKTIAISCFALKYGVSPYILKREIMKNYINEVTI